LYAVAEDSGQNEKPGSLMKQATGATQTPLGGFDMPWEIIEREEEKKREAKRKPMQMALATGLVLVPLALLVFGLTIWYFLQHHLRQISKLWQDKRRE